MTVTPIKILLLNDRADDILLIDQTLRKSKLSFLTHAAHTRAQYTDALTGFGPDIILSAHTLPGFNTLEALALCRTEVGDTPFIVVSGAASEDFAAKCLREGADDYIPLDTLALLPASIRLMLKKRKRKQQEREQQVALRKENRKLTAINQELGNFTYRVSHHLRSPVATAMGLLQLARQTTDRQGTESLHEMIEVSLNRLDRTLKCLLECSRNTYCKPTLATIDWDALIRNAFARVEYPHSAQQTTKLLNLRTDIPAISDHDRLAVILGNVLSNCLTYRQTGPNHETVINIDVETTLKTISIVVRDNGIGIRADALPRVGEMFFRGTENGQGAGLGIYVAREILAPLEGKIDIASTEGVGTTVHIELPNGQLAG